ncbi:MAG TPA: NotI family restriction endonuclease [Nitrosomonas sp.]|nr:NotI family restriction endonuclease [Nitrosomonas sp.]
MSLTRPTNKDLVEIFGYAPDDLTQSVRSLWNLGACPFINKACSKSNHDSSVVYGTCSVTTTFGDCIICPNRLYEKDYATLRAVAEDAFGKVTKFVLFDEYIKRRNENSIFVVALGQNSGKEVKIGRSLSMDWVLAKIENNQLIEYVGIEVQSIDITNNYRDAWYAYKNLTPNTKIIPSSEHGMNWANVHKRLIPQIIQKGIVYSNSQLVKAGLYFVLPDIVYRKFEDIIGADIPLVTDKGANVLTIHTYDLSPPTSHGQQRILVNKRKIRVSLDEFSQRFISGPNLPTGDELDEAVKRILGCY